jgi:hypothetical protein
MKWIVSFILSLAACGLLFLGLCAGPQMLGRSASGIPGETEPSPCLTDATIQVTANPVKVTLGQSSVVSWSVGLPTGCGDVHVRFNGQSVARSGSQTVTPPRNSTFTVLVSATHLGVYGETSRSAQVEVTYPPVVCIDPTTQNPVAVLLGALTDSTNDKQTVELCDVDLDLTGITSILVSHNNRSLIASPACARGPRSFGPRIFVTDRRGSAALFDIRGDNVCFSGFRLQGPTSDMGSDNTEVGISIWPSASPDPIYNIEISNMEISQWSGAGVKVEDNDEKAQLGRLFNTNVGAVHIWNNFFHRNRHGSGFGYGVDVGGAPMH